MDFDQYASSALIRLKELLAEGKAMAFLGAGASAPIYPVWNAMVEALAAKAKTAGCATTNDIAQWRQQAPAKPDLVLQSIQKRMGEAAFRASVSELFAPRRGQDGNDYTPVQAAVARGAFKGIVTTNYDSGLIQARSAELSWIHSTGYCTWADRERLGGWYSGDVFEEEDLPILYAHGIHEDPENLVVTLWDYRRTYHESLLKTVVERLFGTEHLIFIGFSLSDPWFRFATDRIVFNFARGGRHRHIAILPFPPNAANLDGEAENLADVYDCDLLPYATSDTLPNTHHRLLELLNSIALEFPRKAVATVIAPPSRKGRSRDLWVHETTNDHRFAGRAVVLGQLDRWAADPTVRTIGVTGMGGQGKTALIGHWLKDYRPGRGLDSDPVFYWSLYADRSVRECLSRFLSFSRVGARSTSGSLVEATIEAFKAARVVFVLDGLEVLQERPGSHAYGTLLHDELRELLWRACHDSHRSLIVLTSRFPFADLRPFIAKSLRLLSIESLSPDDGSALLERAGVGGSSSDRELISRYFEGHPLALRVMAAAIRTTSKGDPSRIWGRFKGAPGSSGEDQRGAKLIRLLEFYRSALPLGERGILGALSLFRYPVTWATMSALVGKSPSGGTLRQDLDRLAEDGLILRELVGGQQVFSCHPILRDHFRNAVLGSNRNLATRAAALLTDVPAVGHPRDITEIGPALDALAVLLDAGFYEDAHRIFQDRLMGGEVFFTLPALGEGMRAALGFVADDSRRRACQSALSRRDTSSYLNMTAYFGCYAGELEHAANFFELSEQLNRSHSDTPNLVSTLRNRAEVECLRGNLVLARRLAREAVSLSERLSTDSAARSLARCQLGFILFLEGKLEQADRHFAHAAEARGGDDRLLGPGEVMECEALLRLGQLARANDLADRLNLCNRRREWRDQSAQVSLLLGALKLKRRRYKEADSELRKGEVLLRQGHLFSLVPRALLLRATLARYSKEYDDATRLVDEALSISTARDLVLSEVDALLERASCLLESAPRSVREEVHLVSALEDASSAYKKASSAGYAWATVEASTVSAKAAEALGLSDDAVEWKRRQFRAQQRLK